MALSSRQPKTPRAAAIDNKLVPETPLDFSFLEIEDLNELTTLDPRPVGSKKPEKNSDEKYNAKCVRLNNNRLASASALAEVFGKLLIEPGTLSWLDLSFNELKTIDDAIVSFVSLQILYLHGNKIDKREEVEKLSKLTNLRKLCLHGNPIENGKNYKWFVLSLVPNVQNLDMSAVTKTDRVTASCFKRSLEASKAQKKDKEEE